MGPRFAIPIGLDLSQGDQKSAEKYFRSIGLSADESAKRVKALKEEAGGLGAGLAKLASDAGKLDTAMARGNVGAMEKYIARMITGLDKYQAEIQQAQAAGSPVSPQAIADLERMRAGLDRAIASTGQIKAGMETARRATDDATRAAGGFGKGINSVSDLLGLANPKLEQMAIKAGLAGGAIAVVNRLAADATSTLTKLTADLGFNSEANGRAANGLKRHIDAMTSWGAAYKAPLSGLQQFKDWFDQLTASIGTNDKALQSYTDRVLAKFGLTTQQAVAFAEAAASSIKQSVAATLQAVTGMAGAAAAVFDKYLPKKDSKAQFSNVQSAGNSLGGASLAAAEALERQKEATKALDAETRRLVADQQLLTKQGRLTGEAILSLGKRSEGLVASYKAQGREAPRVLAGLAAQAKAHEVIAGMVQRSADEQEKSAARSEKSIAQLVKAAEDQARAAGTEIAKIFKERIEKGFASINGKPFADVVRLARELGRIQDARWEVAIRTGALSVDEVGYLREKLEVEQLIAFMKEHQLELTEEQIAKMRAGVRMPAGITTDPGGIDWKEAAQATGVLQSVFMGLDSTVGRVGAAISGMLQRLAEGTSKWAAGLEAAATIAMEFAPETTAGGFGAKGVTNYAGIGSIIGTIIGGILGAGAFSAQGAAIGSAIGAAVGSMIVSGADEALGKVQLDSGAFTVLVSKWEGGLNLVLEDLAKNIDSSIKGLLAAINATIVSATGLEVKVRDGVISVFVNGITGRFKSMDEAVSFAVTELLKSSSLIGLSDTLKTILGNTKASDLDSLTADIDFGMWYDAIGLGDVGAQIVEAMADFRVKFMRAVELGLDPGPVLENAKKRFAGFRESLLGINMAAADALAGLLSWQTGTQAVADQLRSSLEQTEAAIAKAEALKAQTAPGPGYKALTDEEQKLVDAIPGLRAAIQSYLAQLEAIPKALSDQEIDIGIFDALFAYLKDDPKYAAQSVAYAKLKLEIEFAGIKAQLIALGKWEQFAGMFDDAYAAALAAAGGRPNRGGNGGNRQADRQGVVDALRDFDLSKLGAAQRGLADINKRWDDHAKAAHGNADLLAKIAAARREEIELLLKQLALGLKRDVGDFLGRGGALGGALRGIDENAQGLIDRARDLMKAGKMTKDEFLRLRDTIRDAQAGQRQSMVQNAANSLFQELYGLLGMDKEAAQLKFDLTVAELHIKLEELKIAVKKYELEGKFIPGLEDLIKRVEAAGPGIFSGGSGGAVGTFDVTDIQTAIQQRMATALEMLRRYQGQNGTGNSAFMQELARVQQDFLQIREALGNTLEVQTAYAAAIRDVITRFLDPVRDQLREMQYGEASVLSPLEQFQSIFAEAQAAAARFAAGDLSVVETAPQLIQQLLALAGQAMPQGGAGYRSVYEWAQAFLNQMLGLQTAPLNPQGNPIPGPAPVFPVGTATFPGTTSAQILGTLNNQGAVRPVTDAIVGARDMQIVELRAIRAAVERQANATERMERFRGMAWEVA